MITKRLIHSTLIFILFAGYIISPTLIDVSAQISKQNDAKSETVITPDSDLAARLAIIEKITKDIKFDAAVPDSVFRDKEKS